MNNQLKITPLGGQEEIGLNSTLIETDEDAVIVDLGNNFEDTDFGVNYYIPNIDLVAAKLDKLRGVLITHGHYDHRAAIAFLIDKLGYPPVYGSPFTLQLIKQRLEEHRKLKSARLIPINPRQEIALGKIRVKAIHLTHSILGSYGYFIKTLQGNVFHTGDFKFDDTPFEEQVSDYESLKRAGEEGVLVAMIDSTRANVGGHSRSETAIADNLEKLVKEAQGRIIVSTFAQMISRINQVARIGRKYNRQIFVEGLTLERVIRIAKEMRIIDPGLKFRESGQMANFADSQIMLFATGSQGEKRAALTRMLEANKGVLRIRSTDTIILSSSTIPDNVVAIQKLVDRFADQGCRVFTDDIIDIHAGGHAHQDELKQMIQFLKPNFVFPVSGYISFRQQLGRLASSLGYRKTRIILAKNNQTVFVDRQGFRKRGGVVKKPSVVMGGKIIKNGAEIVSQRKKAAQRGLVTISVNLKRRKTKVSSWGVAGEVFDQIQKDLRNQKILRPDPGEMRKIVQKSLRVHFDDELIPVIRVEMV